MTGREWAASDTFSLADCAAAPSLFYADWAHPIGQGILEGPRLPATAALTAIVRAGGRGGAAISSELSARRTRS